MSMLDLFLTNPADPAERAQLLADIEELRRLSSRCDCDRCCTSCAHETWCPAVAGAGCPECGDDGDECHACGTGVAPETA